MLCGLIVATVASWGYISLELSSLVRYIPRVEDFWSRAAHPLVLCFFGRCRHSSMMVRSAAGISRFEAGDGLVMHKFTNADELDGSYFGRDNATGYVLGRFYRCQGGKVTFGTDGFILWSDAEGLLDRLVSPEVSLERGLSRTEDIEEGYRPDSVELAFEFIRHCNRMMMPVPVVRSSVFDGTKELVEEVVKQELIPKQEAVLRVACNVLGRYMSEQFPDCAEEDG